MGKKGRAPRVSSPPSGSAANGKPQAAPEAPEAPKLPGLLGTIQDAIKYAGWAWRNWPRVPRSYRLLIVLVVLTSLGGAFSALVTGFMPRQYGDLTRRWDIIRVRLGLADPRPYNTGDWIDVPIGNDGSWWDAPGGNTRTDVTDNMRIRIFDPGPAVLLKTGQWFEALQNFSVVFGIRVRENQTSAEWLIRTDGGRKNGYRFRYTFPQEQSEGLLQGWLYDGGRIRTGRVPCEERIYRGVIPAGHMLRVKCTVAGNRISHWMKLIAVPKSPLDRVHDQAGIRMSSSPCVFEGNPRRFGAFGILAEGKPSAIQVQSFALLAFGDQTSDPNDQKRQ